jgi:hypothetical protein
MNIIKKTEVLVCGVLCSLALFSNLEAKEIENKIQSAEFNFGMELPKEWEFQKFPQTVMYGYAIEKQSAKELGFATNFNLVIEKYDESKGNLEIQLKSVFQQILKALKNAELKKSEKFVLNSNPAYKTQVIYSEDDKRLVMYQVTSFNQAKKTMYHLTFTTLKSEFDKNKPLFDKAIDSFRFLK